MKVLAGRVLDISSPFISFLNGMVSDDGSIASIADLSIRISSVMPYSVQAVLLADTRIPSGVVTMSDISLVYSTTPSIDRRYSASVL